MSTNHKKIKIAISQVAPLIGLDHYNNFAKIVCELWRKYDKEKFNMKEKEYQNKDRFDVRKMVLRSASENALSVSRSLADFSDNKPVPFDSKKRLHARIKMSTWSACETS